MRYVYLDNAATTKTAEEVVEFMQEVFTEKYGNASSFHKKGREAKQLLEWARDVIAKKVKAKSESVIFTSGGTESNNLAIKGLAFHELIKNKAKKHIIVTSCIEHSALLNTCKWLEHFGFKTIKLDVDRQGFINLHQLQDVLENYSKQILVVSIMTANNEIGTIQPIKEIAKLCNEHHIVFHTDAVQALGKIDNEITLKHADMISISSHKLHGPKGVGALIVREEVKQKLMPLLHGGPHEFKLRAGTENLPCIAGFAKALQLLKEKDKQHMIKLRNKLIKELSDVASLNGPYDEKAIKRACHNTNFWFGVDSEFMGLWLDAKNIATSAGSACHTASPKPSHVLLAIGLSKEKAKQCLRLTLSKYTTLEEIEYAIDCIKTFTRKYASK